MSTFLIETTEQDSFLAVARYIGDLLLAQSELKTSLAATPASNMIKEAEKMLASGSYGSLLDLLTSHLELLFEQTESSDVECCINVMCHLVPRVEPASASVNAACNLTDKLASSTTQKPSFRLQAMLELFNTLVSSEAQHKVLLKVLAFAKAATVTILATSLRGKAEAWATQWELTREESAHLFIACADILELHPSPVMKKEAFTLVNKALSRFTAKDTEMLAALKPIAHTTALQFIANPNLFSCDLIGYPIVQQLKGDRECARTLELLAVMVAGDLKGYKAGSYEEVLKQAGMTPEECLDKMRLMALLNLAGQYEGQELEFETIEAELGLGKDEAETWVVRAFGKQLLEGRINQIKEVVLVKRCETRTFEAAGWKRLLEDLTMWKESVCNIEGSMQDSKLLTPTATVQPWLAT